MPADAAGRSRAGVVPRAVFIGFAREFYTRLLQLALQFSYIREVVQRSGLVVPSGVERHDVLVEHALEDADRLRAGPQDQPVLRGISGELPEAELLVEGLGGLEILDGQAD